MLQAYEFWRRQNTSYKAALIHECSLRKKFAFPPPDFLLSKQSLFFFEVPVENLHQVAWNVLRCRNWVLYRLVILAFLITFETCFYSRVPKEIVSLIPLAILFERGVEISKNTNCIGIIFWGKVRLNLCCNWRKGNQCSGVIYSIWQ